MAISDAQFAAWLLQDNAPRCVLVELDYQYDFGGLSTTGTLRYSTLVFFDSTGAKVYQDCVASVPQFTRSLGGTLFGTYSSSLGTLELDNADGAQDTLLTLALDGSAIRFYLGDQSWAVADFRFIFSALSVKATAPAWDRISVQLKDTGLLLDKSIGGTIKVGGTGPNADQWRPVNFGMVHQVPTQVLDQSVLTYVHSDDGLGLSTGHGPYVETVRDRGIPVVFTDRGDGTFTLAASPDGTITADLLYSNPSDAEFRCISDAMAFFVGDRSGLSTIGLYYGAGSTFGVRPSSGSGTTFVSDWIIAGGEDYQIGINITDKRNVIDLLGELTDSGLCFWAIRRDGKFTFGRLRPNYIAGLGVASTHTFTEDDILGSWQIEHMTPEYYQLQATTSKNWTIISNLASSLGPATQAKLTRAGLYVLQNLGVGTDYANAPQLYNKTLAKSPVLSTLLSDADDLLAARILVRWMETRRAMALPWISVASMAVGLNCYDLELGDPITLQVLRYGYDAGVSFQVTSIAINLPNNIELKAIRRDAQAAYSSRTTTPEPGAPFSGPAKILTAVASFIAGVAFVGNGATALAKTLSVTASFIPGTASAGSGGGGGTVISVDQAVPVEFTISGNPVTSIGTLTIGKANETANTVWAGPTSGAAAQPTFRLLTNTDIPAAFPYYAGNYGDGSDGDLTASAGTTTITRDTYYQNVTLTGTAKLNTNGFRLFINGTLDISNAAVGAVGEDGTDGANASSFTGGGSTASQANGYFGAGGQGATGQNGSALTGANGNVGQSAPGVGNGGAHTGASGAGGTGVNPAGTGKPAITNAGSYFIRHLTTILFKEAAGSITTIAGGAGSASGGAGGGDNAGHAAGGSGSGGNGGCVVAMFVRTIALSSSTPAKCITAKGGKGGNGGNGQTGGGFGATGGGGGAGGAGGGWIYLVYGAITGATSNAWINADGGDGGNGGIGGQTGANGTAGDGGDGGNIIWFSVSTGFQSWVNGAAGGTHITNTGGTGGSSSANPTT